MEQKRALSEVSKEELRALLADWGQPRYRADQIWHWLYVSLVSDPGQMRNLPTDLRARLAETFTISSVRPLRTQRSQDSRTEKVLLALADGQSIETVLMSYDGRLTVCVSSQVGCAVRCAFCATGVGGWQRDLTAGEIVDQVLHYARQLKASEQSLSNIVYMGMGEPLLNTDAVLRSISVLNDPSGLNLGARRITISTVGIVPGIERLAREAPAVGLAVSLHAPTDELRNRLVPVNRRYPLGMLIQACRDYVNKTRRRVTFEYAMIDGVNDAPAQ
ncbi:MAG: 23S rRNA (adenine(2503)-C(2))-methyltransferase RlmN, partial [Anaerolineae bacterium]|nr:23S rRNA (adenine(2503)-C(2))-methyltransferase RlmN [Anaerolineae bacterium]